MNAARSILVRLVPWALLAGCGASSPAPVPPPAAAPIAPTAIATASPPAPTTHARSVDLAAMDRSVAPGADFYAYANGGWLKTAEIPADRSSTGPFLRMVEESEKRTKAILEDLASGAGKTADEKKAGDYYAAFMDEAAIEKAGAAPLKAPLAAIGKIGDKRALAKALGASLRADVDALNTGDVHTPNFLGLWAEQDLDDPSRVTAYLLQGGIAMPDRDYYLADSPRMAELRTKYQAHLVKAFTLAGMKDADARAARVVALEKKIAAVHASHTESEDVKKGDNPWAPADFAKKAPGLDWAGFFAAAGLEKQTRFVVWHPAATTGEAALVASEPLDAWKDWLAAHVIDEHAPLLAKAFVDEHFAFYDTALLGTPEIPARWKRGLHATGAAIGDAVGQVYAARHFPAERKQAILAIVENIKSAFARRIDGLAWMSPATKAKAKAKLAALIVGVGYPDHWVDYGSLEIDRKDPVGNFDRAKKARYTRELAKLGKPQDRSAWAMEPFTVNALNLPIRNALNFPAAILEPPFYVEGATPAANYASIGAVIGHEISHSFDTQGALFDVTGKLTNWWSPEDFAHFEASAAALAAQYDTYRPFPDASVNGKQTLAENIADLAGLAAAYDAWRASLDGQPAPIGDGLTGDQQFFLGYAQTWQNKMREASLRARLVADGHAPPQYRALTVRNIDAWYPAFDVKPTDPLYLAPASRVRVW